MLEDREEGSKGKERRVDKGKEEMGWKDSSGRRGEERRGCKWRGEDSKI